MSTGTGRQAWRCSTQAGSSEPAWSAATRCCAVAKARGPGAVFRRPVVARISRSVGLILVALPWWL